MSDVGWSDSCGLRWAHATGDDSYGVIQCNMQLISVGAAAPSW